MERFEQTLAYKLIYVFSMPYDDHKGLLKVGEATLKSNKQPNDILPNSRDLNQAAHARIKQEVGTASVRYTLLHTELAVRTVGNYLAAFSDKDVQKVLMNSGIHKVQPNGKTGAEWFATNIETAKAAIKALKEGKSSLSSADIAKITPHETIEFREEQIDAVNKTLKAFKKDDEMLWYAKMRFGKTLTALEVIRRNQYRRVIIVTHRPVVDDGWSDDFKKVFFPGNSEHDYFYERKTKDSAYIFDEKTDYENDLKIRNHDKNGDHFIYFASMQDLRGSQIVGGNFNKNNAVFALDWDLIVIDEAHEGTQTELGDNVVKALKKEHTKVLALSGTPFNLLDKFGEENVYTWDYVMEQKKKSEWDLVHYGDHNPYADLPQMHIYTYDLGEKLKKYISDDYGTKAFNFREFFRVWYKGPNGNRELPKNAVEGKFVHENDVNAFFDLMVTEDANSGYPYSTQEYRDMFRHTLWMVPGVKEAKALSELLRSHPVFKNFGIANVAGEGDKYEEEHSNDALELVRDTIKNYDHSITLSCGKLTTGVTVKEWTAVLMLSGSYSTAAAQYMQTIFRVQSAGTIDGKQKTDCYVFDFAPDRTLKVLTETVHLSRKPGKSQQKRREAMTEFLNYCPVIAIAGSKTKTYSVESMMEQIKQIYAERAVNSGFEDESLYNDELLKLNEIDASKFNELKDIIGASKASKKKKDVVVNGQGLTDEQIEHLDDPEPATPPTPSTPEELEGRKKKKQAKEARKKAIDILRGVSIRMPLMIYGADVPIDEDIDIDSFVDIVDDESWKEFMPTGVTKEIFSEFTKYYDRDVFIAAGKRIRRLAASADRETPTRRVVQIAEIFRHFKNPDKETVLTPWRVVNMHMSETLGGWCFFNENFEDDTQEEKHRLEEPRFVDRGEVTKTVFSENAKILEINSKTGLYPLYVAYSFYKQRMEGMSDDDWAPEECQYFWNEVIRDNVYVICKTPMAKSITRRTLCGYSDVKCNAHYFDDLVNMLKNKPEQFKKRVLKGSYWKKDVKEMKFDAVVGNPPYQEETGGSSRQATPIYNLFVEEAKMLNPRFISMIMPSRWFAGGMKTLDEFRDEMIHDKRIVSIKDFVNAKDCFPSSSISGGVCFFLFDEMYSGNCAFTNVFNGVESTKIRPLDEFDTLIRYNDAVDIVHKLHYHNFIPFDNIISPLMPFGLPTNYRGRSKPSPKDNLNLYASNGLTYISQNEIIKGSEYIGKYKVLMSKMSAEHAGEPDKNGMFSVFTKTMKVLEPNEVCTHSYFLIGCFDTKSEAEAVLKYLKTRFVRFLVMITLTAVNLSKLVFFNVPMQNFSEDSDIDWSRNVTDIESQLYEKYELTDNEIELINSMIKPMDATSYYESMLKMSYQDIVSALLKKYGSAKHNYFKDTACKAKNPLVTRTNEGLFCHHIDEDKAIMLCNDKFAVNNHFEYQKADRLVYCNLLEHLLLHVKIAENPNPDANENELPGIGGAINFICKDLNDIYSGKEFADEWRKNVANKVKDNFDDYIIILRYLWNIVEKNPIYKLIITKDMLFLNSADKVVEIVKTSFNDGE